MPLSVAEGAMLGAGMMFASGATFAVSARVCGEVGDVGMVCPYCCRRACLPACHADTPRPACKPSG